MLFLYNLKFTKKREQHFLWCSAKLFSLCSRPQLLCLSSLLNICFATVSYLTASLSPPTESFQYQSHEICQFKPSDWLLQLKHTTWRGFPFCQEQIPARITLTFADSKPAWPEPDVKTSMNQNAPGREWERVKVPNKVERESSRSRTSDIFPSHFQIKIKSLTILL